MLCAAPSNLAKDWAGARHTCSAYGGHLVTVGTERRLKELRKGVAGNVLIVWWGGAGLKERVSGKCGRWRCGGVGWSRKVSARGRGRGGRLLV